jgi:hypothetical protein
MCWLLLRNAAVLGMMIIAAIKITVMTEQNHFNGVFSFSFPSGSRKIHHHRTGAKRSVYTGRIYRGEHTLGKARTV